MDNICVPSGVVVSDHAIGRLRLRFRRARSWSRQQCERWIVEAVNGARFTIKRKNGEVYIQATLFGHSLYLALLPSADGATCLVRTILPHDFAANNLNRRSP